ncbi:hypothetical protein QTP86_000183 [Hemibagrus guttatus]|nr:hypothetical protein QTP86_000183 [Hemibagrus guttatus]
MPMLPLPQPALGINCTFLTISMLKCFSGVISLGSSVTLGQPAPGWWCNRGSGGPLCQDIKEFVTAYLACNQSKSLCTAPAGLLHLLPVPRCPWSHIAIDFITGQPPSEGNTILTIVDRFSKMVHFVPLSHLPSAKETALLLVQHVFRLHGISRDIVSDRGPQFTAQFWTESGAELTPFQVVYGYQPPLFESQKKECSVPSARAAVRRCHLAWRRT